MGWNTPATKGYVLVMVITAIIGSTIGILIGELIVRTWMR